MEKRKILFLAESLSVGGAEKALVSILKLIDYNELDVTLMLISRTGYFMPELDRVEGLKVRHIVKPSNNPFLRILNSIKVKLVYKLCPASMVGNYLCKGYDVVIAFCEGYLTKWVGASTVQCKKIAWVHTDMLQNDWPLNTGVFNCFEDERDSYQKFDKVVCVSGLVADGMRKKFRCEQPAVIYNIIDTDIISKSRQLIPHIAKAKLNIVSVGRLEYVKGYDLLIEAISILVNKKHLDIHLCLVGDGSQRSVLEQKIAEANLQNNIMLAGLQVNPYPFVYAADLFVCPSRQEGFNIAILEAMILGKPIIATNTAGPSEILKNGACGMIADVSAEGLSQAIERCYIDQSILTEYSLKSIERAQDFTNEKQMDAIVSLIEQ